ncbi:hypothetical protein AVEN_17888-1 [Araneus ventricosus]|uniref:Uncharacterized protein n=1 Tax=Araneus ventricosus TaxID=182803 RepID=A0A4Y2I6E9_ARAVE|nr:hypothetical protein AVEN_17888-1 [Araneus ventricosus]
MLQTFTFLFTWPVECAWLEEYTFSMSINSRLTFWDSISLGNELPYSRYPDGTVHHARLLLIQGFHGRILSESARNVFLTTRCIPWFCRPLSKLLSIYLIFPLLYILHTLYEELSLGPHLLHVVRFSVPAVPLAQKETKLGVACLQSN